MEQMELEFFVEPGKDEEWHQFWVKNRLDWWSKQGVPKKRLDLYDVPTKERAHYSKSTIDIMYKFPHGTEELEGIANRTDFDLGSHTKNQSDLSISAKVQKNFSSNARLAIQNKENQKWTVPYVIEPAAGVDRGFLAVLNEAYAVEKLEDGNWRVTDLGSDSGIEVNGKSIEVEKVLNPGDLIKIGSVELTFKVKEAVPVPRARGATGPRANFFYPATQESIKSSVWPRN